MYQSNMNAEDKALELAVICTGDMTDEVLSMEKPSQSELMDSG